MRRNGTGSMARLMKPRRLLPHPMPRAEYIFNPARGSTAPAIDRTTVLAASALAAYAVKASTRYLNRSVQAAKRGSDY